MKYCKNFRCGMFVVNICHRVPLYSYFPLFQHRSCGVIFETSG